MSQPEKDIWFEWLKKRRFAGESQPLEEVTKTYHTMRDRVLEPLDLSGGKTLLDVGCGDGLIAFGALGKSPDGKVIFCDISQDLLDDCQQIAQDLGVQARCTFLNASAENLGSLLDASVDAVTTRSVLIYVNEKRKALAEFYRVLRRGGKLSIFEPINRFGLPRPEGFFWGYDIRPVWEIGKKLLNLYEMLQPVGSDPMLDFDERDLLMMIEQSGFSKIDLKYQATIDKRMKVGWEILIHAVGNPKIPSLEEAMEQILSPEERRQFEDYLRPVVESGFYTSRGAQVYLWAEK